MIISNKFHQILSAKLLRFFHFCLLGSILLTATPALAQLKTEQSLLWKISGGGLKEPSYLYGTIHAICPQDLQLTAAMLLAMQQSKQLALEVNIGSAAEIKQMQAGMQMQSPGTLRELLPAHEYKLIEGFYRDSLGISLAALQSTKPLFVASLLYPKLLDCPVVSYEQQLARLMDEQNKPVVGLERADEHVRILDAIPYQEQARLLLEAVRNYERLKGEYWDMVVSYKNRDLKSLFEVVRETNLGLKNYEKQLLHDRNRRWIPSMESLSRSKATFFAVGAAHLPGEDGLIKLLQRRGYTLEPLEF